MQKGDILDQVVAFAAAQPCALRGEQHSFFSAGVTMASGKTSWETEQPMANASDGCPGAAPQSQEDAKG